MQEEWKDIIIEKNGVLYDYVGLYQVSNFGRIKSFRGKDKSNGKILKVKPGKSGYVLVTLYKDYDKQVFKVHRLVATAFIPNPDNKPEVNHIDENKENNNVMNLEWVTTKENNSRGTKMQRQADKIRGRKLSEELKNRMGKSHMKKVICIETGEVFDSIKAASEKYPSPSSCLKGRSKTCGRHQITGEKLHWMYYDEWLEQQNK